MITHHYRYYGSVRLFWFKCLECDFVSTETSSYKHRNREAAAHTCESGGINPDYPGTCIGCSGAEIMAGHRESCPDAIEESLCQWFAKCVQPARHLVRHPVLGNVPTCNQCVAKLNMQARVVIQ